PAGDRGIQDLDGMSGAQSQAARAQKLLDLKSASRVGAGQKIRLDGEDVVRLARPDLFRAFGLHQVVDAGAPAALVALGDLDELEAGDAGEERSRRLPDALRVGEMAGVVVRDPRAQGMPGGDRRQGGQELTDVADLRGEGRRAGTPLRIAREETAV